MDDPGYLEAVVLAILQETDAADFYLALQQLFIVAVSPVLFFYLLKVRDRRATRAAKMAVEGMRRDGHDAKLCGTCQGKGKLGWSLFLASARTLLFRRVCDTCSGSGFLRDCRLCGYNLTGNTSGICPECATPIPKDNTEPEPTSDPPQTEASV